MAAPPLPTRPFPVAIMTPPMPLAAPARTVRLSQRKPLGCSPSLSAEHFQDGREEIAQVPSPLRMNKVNRLGQSPRKLMRSYEALSSARTPEPAGRRRAALHEAMARTAPPRLPRRSIRVGRFRDSIGFAETALDIRSQTFAEFVQTSKRLLLKSLGVGDIWAKVEATQGIAGAQNDGIYFVRGKDTDLVLKLVSNPVRGGPSEAERLRAIYDEHPEIAADPTLAFPFKVIKLLSHGRPLGKDLIAMETVPGRSLAETIPVWQARGRGPALTSVFHKVGEVLGVFHRRYGGKRHCDLQSSNIFWDEALGHLTFIDLGGMGSREVVRSDQEHFAHSVRMCETYYGPLVQTWLEAFDRGYDSARSISLRECTRRLSQATPGSPFCEAEASPCLPPAKATPLKQVPSESEASPSPSGSPGSVGSMADVLATRRDEEPSDSGQKRPWTESIQGFIRRRLTFHKVDESDESDDDSGSDRASDGEGDGGEVGPNGLRF